MCQAVVFDEALELLDIHRELGLNRMRDITNQDGSHRVALKTTNGSIKRALQAGIESLCKQLVDVHNSAEKLKQNVTTSTQW